MSIAHSIILGLIEGITEFLPISSTAHLIIVSQLLKIEQTEFLKLFEVVIQSGAILAVSLLYFKFILDHKSLILNLLISFIPTAIIGFLFHDTIKTVFFESNLLIAASLLGGGVLFIILEYLIKQGRLTLSKSLDTLPYSHAILIGIFQAMAIVPGVSRAGAVIVVMILLRYKRTDSAIYSFLLAAPTIFAAGVFDLIKTDINVLSHGSNLLLLAVGFISAFISALLVLRWFIAYLQQNTLTIFGVYRIILGLLLALFIIR